MSEGTHIHRLLVPVVVAGLLLCPAVCNKALADDICPAYLDIEEFEPGALRVVWKVPRVQSVPALFAPSFPDSFKATSPKKRVETPNAIIEKWTMVCGAEGLAGAMISIEGLEQTAMDALVRIQLADGSMHRAILRPADPSTTVAASEATVSGERGGIQSMLRLARPWLYPMLFLVAWLLSMTSRARRRGIILCTVALIAGSLCGHALGRLPIAERLRGVATPSDAEAKRILRGLMLNTYRAFMLDNDEQIYDVLARSVEGEFLSEVYLQNREALRMDPTDAAVSIVDRLDIKSIESKERLKNGAIAIVASWDVYGSVLHWGHIHFRCNTYKAVLTIAPADNYWKLSSLEVLEQDRVI